MAVDQPGHRSGSLKQANKGHKHGAHRSKRAIDAANKGTLRFFFCVDTFFIVKFFIPTGRVSVKASTIKARRELKREERRHQSNQVTFFRAIFCLELLSIFVCRYEKINVRKQLP